MDNPTQAKVVRGWNPRKACYEEFKVIGSYNRQPPAQLKIDGGRVAVSEILNPNLKKVVELFRKEKRPLSAFEISELSGIPVGTLRTYLQDIYFVVHTRQHKAPTTWVLAPAYYNESSPQPEPK